MPGNNRAEQIHGKMAERGVEREASNGELFLTFNARGVDDANRVKPVRSGGAFLAG